MPNFGIATLGAAGAGAAGGGHRWRPRRWCCRLLRARSGIAPVLFVPGTVPVTGLVGAADAGDDGAGEVMAGSLAVVPGCAQPARAKSSPAAGIISESLPIIVILTSGL